MKKTFKVLVSIIGGLLALLFLTVTYFAIAPTIIGPKIEVQDFCSAIPVGTTAEDLEIISGGHSLQPIFGVEEGDQSKIDTNNGTVQVDLRLKNGWVCICQVEMKDGIVSQPNEVFCSD